MRKKGFTLIEVLAGVLIIGIAFSTLLYLHLQSLKYYRQAYNTLEAITRISAYLSGVPQEGIKVEEKNLRVEGFQVNERKIYWKNFPEVYFKLWQVK
jgi:prepilin-type N-terminal cleavage/methylation domain-containing protein